MIVTFTDFGWQGTYLAEIELQLAKLVPNERILHLIKDAPKYNPHAAGCLLATHVNAYPKHTVFLGVVDPDVGSDRRKPVVLFADDRWYVGPGNGLFDSVALAAEEPPKWFEIIWQPEQLTRSFHGRDLFAPIAAHIANKFNVDTVCRPLEVNREDLHGGCIDTVIYIDHFGNCMTGISGASGKQLKVGDTVLDYAETFSDVQKGQPFWYFNSVGLVELAVNQGSAAEQLKLAVGDKVSML